MAAPGPTRKKRVSITCAVCLDLVTNPVEMYVAKNKMADVREFATRLKLRVVKVKEQVAPGDKPKDSVKIRLPLYRGSRDNLDVLNTITALACGHVFHKICLTHNLTVAVGAWPYKKPCPYCCKKSSVPAVDIKPTIVIKDFKPVESFATSPALKDVSEVNCENEDCLRRALIHQQVERKIRLMEMEAIATTTSRQQGPVVRGANKARSDSKVSAPKTARRKQGAAFPGSLAQRDQVRSPTI